MAKKHAHQPRDFRLELYEQLIHRNPIRTVAVLSELNAKNAANKHMETNNAIKLVCRKSDEKGGRVLWTKLKIGRHLITQIGHQHADEIVVEVPDKEAP